MAYKRSLKSPSRDVSNSCESFKKEVDLVAQLTTLEKQYHKADSKLQDVLSELKSSRQIQEGLSRDLQKSRRVADCLSEDKHNLEHQVSASKGSIRKLEVRLANALKNAPGGETTESLAKQIEQLKLAANGNAKLINDLERERHRLTLEVDTNKRLHDNQSDVRYADLLKELKASKITADEERQNSKRLTSEIEIISGDYVKSQKCASIEQQNIKQLRAQLMTVTEKIQEGARTIEEVKMERSALKSYVETVHEQLRVVQSDLDCATSEVSNSKKLREEETVNRRRLDTEWKQVAKEKDRQLQVLKNEIRDLNSHIESYDAKYASLETRKQESDHLVEKMAVQTSKLTSELTKAASATSAKESDCYDLRGAISQRDNEINHLNVQVKRQELAWQQSQRDAADIRSQITMRDNELKDKDKALKIAQIEKHRIAKAAEEAVNRCAIGVMESPKVTERLENRLAHIEALKKSLMKSAISSQAIAKRITKTEPQGGASATSSNKRLVKLERENEHLRSLLTPAAIETSARIRQRSPSPPPNRFQTTSSTIKSPNRTSVGGVSDEMDMNRRGSRTPLGPPLPQAISNSQEGTFDLYWTSTPREGGATPKAATPQAATPKAVSTPHGGPAGQLDVEMLGSDKALQASYQQLMEAARALRAVQQK